MSAKESQSSPSSGCAILVDFAMLPGRGAVRTVHLEEEFECEQQR
jgi:hypothetical protein